jgi:hypothetical protein
MKKLLCAVAEYFATENDSTKKKIIFYFNQVKQKALYYRDSFFLSCRLWRGATLFVAGMTVFYFSQIFCVHSVCAVFTFEAILSLCFSKVEIKSMLKKLISSLSLSLTRGILMKLKKNSMDGEYEIKSQGQMQETNNNVYVLQGTEAVCARCRRHHQPAALSLAADWRASRFFKKEIW